MVEPTPTRGKNHLAWIGALVSVFGLVSYFAVFVRFPALRDVPWVNLPLVLVGAGLSLAALWRRRSIWSTAGTVLSVACAGFLVLYVFVLSDLPPVADSAIQVGDPAPAFSLPDQDGRLVRLSDYAGSNAVVVFYRGFW